MQETVATITLWTTSKKDERSTHKFSSWEGRADEGTRLPVRQPSQHGHRTMQQGEPTVLREQDAAQTHHRALSSGLWYSVPHNSTFLFLLLCYTPRPETTNTTHICSQHCTLPITCCNTNIQNWSYSDTKHYSSSGLGLQLCNSVFLRITSLLGTCANSDPQKMQHERWQGLHQ